MGILDWTRVFGGADDDMARKANTRKAAGDGDEMIAGFAARLSRAGTDKSVFDRTFADLQTSRDLSASAVISIAHVYIGGGKKPTSRAAAISAISKRFVELQRYHAKNRIAEKARPW
jgi:hypothetical protein